MKGINIRVSKSLPASSVPKTNVPQPSTPPPPAPKPPATQTAPKDGFVTKSRGLSDKPAQQPGKDVTQEFTSSPLNFTGTNVLNAYNMSPGSGLQGVALPTPHKPFVPANQSVVSLSVHQKQGNANISVNPPGGPGAQAYYLHYLSTGSGRFAGIEGVPLHPKSGDPSMIVTGPLNGCAVHALHDTSNHTMSFVHHADFSKNGEAELKDFLAQNPSLKLVGSFKPSDYSHSTGKDGIETGATSFIHYSKWPDQSEGQWMMVGQLNDWKNGGTPGGRPELTRPQNIPAPSVYMIPLDV